MTGFRRSRIVRLFAALVVLLASMGAEPAHGTAHVERAPDAIGHGHGLAEHAHEETPVIADHVDGDHDHPRLSDGLVVRFSVLAFTKPGSAPEFEALRSYRSAALPTSSDQWHESASTGPPPRLRAPPIA